MKKHGLLYFIIGLCLIILINYLWPNFLNSVLGITIHAIIVTSLLMPNLPFITPRFFRNLLVRRVLVEILSKATKNEDFNTTGFRLKFNILFKYKVIGKRIITSKDIDEMNSAESAVFILLFQYFYNQICIHSDVQVSNIIKAADKASQNKVYQKILFNSSLIHLFNTNERLKIVESLLSNNDSNDILNVRITVDKAVEQFHQRLTNTKKESIYYFSTTSQMSYGVLEHIKNCSSNIEDLHFFIVSPIYSKDSALEGLKQEYDVHLCSLPAAQFIINNFQLDLIRRIIRILISIDRMLEFKKDNNLNIKLALFDKYYPGVKIVLFNRSKYLQVKVGALKYANNIYRFGIETTKADIVDKFMGQIHRMLNGENISVIEFTDQNIDKLRSTALQIAFKEILLGKISLKEFEDALHSLKFLIKDDYVEYYYNYFINLYRSVDKCIASIDKLDNSKIYQDVRFHKQGLKKGDIYTEHLDNNQIMHVSVGILFFYDRKTFMIIKRRKQYKNKYSIVAGHLENGETPLEAIRREVSEEIGLSIKNISFLTYFDNIKGDSCSYGCHNHKWFVFLCHDPIDEQDIVISEDELKGYEWVKLEDLHTKNMTFACETIFKFLGAL